MYETEYYFPSSWCINPDHRWPVNLLRCTKENGDKKLTANQEVVRAIFEHVKNCKECMAKFNAISAHTVKTMIKENTK